MNESLRLELFVFIGTDNADRFDPASGEIWNYKNAKSRIFGINKDAIFIRLLAIWLHNFAFKNRTFLWILAQD
jgi:hypothetical protein